MNLEALGKLILWAGLALAAAGGALMLFGKLGLGRLPGDVTFGGAHWKVYVPLATSVLLSLLLTLILNVLSRWFR
ncbi:MAG TPA: DUF2905 family protein [Stenomitos sp.]